MIYNKMSKENNIFVKLVSILAAGTIAFSELAFAVQNENPVMPNPQSRQDAHCDYEVQSNQGMLSPMVISKLVPLSDKEIESLLRTIKDMGSEQLKELVDGITGRVVNLKRGWITLSAARWIKKALDTADTKGYAQDVDTLRRAYLYSMKAAIIEWRLNQKRQDLGRDDVALTQVELKTVDDLVVKMSQSTQLLEAFGRIYTSMAGRLREAKEGPSARASSSGAMPHRAGDNVTALMLEHDRYGIDLPGLLNQAAMEFVPSTKQIPLDYLIKDRSRLDQLTADEKNTKLYPIIGWVDRFKELYRQALRDKGLTEFEAEKLVARAALQIINHPSASYRGSDSIYIDDLYYRMLSESPNPDELFISLAKRGAPIDNVLAAIKARTVFVVQGGGDCAGLNTVLSTVAQRLARESYLTIGVREAFKGLMAKDIENYLMPIDTPFAQRIAQRPSTELKSSREDPTKKPEDLEQLRKNIDGYAGVVVTGGDDHLAVAWKLSELIPAVRFIGVPKSIDYDAMTQMLGFFEAQERLQDRFFRAAETGKGPVKVFIAEIMGRKAGWLARGAANRNAYNLSELGRAIGDKVFQVRDTVMILVPEKPASIRTILKRAKEILDKKGALNMAVAEGFSLSERDPLWKELLDKNPLIAEKVKGPKEYDIHGNLRLAGASEFILAILQTRWGDKSLNMGLSREQFRHAIFGYIGRGIRPSNYGLRMAQRYGQKASELVAEGRSGMMVTYPDISNVETEPLVRPISEILTYKGKKLARNLLTLGEGSEVLGRGRPHERDFPMYTNQQLAEEGILMERNGEPYSYDVPEGMVTAENTIHDFETAVRILRQDFLSTAVSGWAHNRGSIFDVPDDDGFLTLIVAGKNPADFKNWPDEDKASWEKIRDTTIILHPASTVSLEDIMKQAKKIKKEHGTVNIVAARGFTFRKDDSLLKQLLTNEPYLNAKYESTNVEVRPGFVRVKDISEFIQGVLVLFAKDTFQGNDHARCNQLSQAYYVAQPTAGEKAGLVTRESASGIEEIKGYAARDFRELKSHLSSVALRPELLKDGVVIVGCDTDIGGEVETSASMLKANKLAEMILGEKTVINIRRPGKDLLKAIQEEVNRLLAGNINIRSIVTIVGDETVKNTGKELEALGKVLNVQGAEWRFMPVAVLYDLAICFAYGMENEIIGCLSRVGLVFDEEGKPLDPAKTDDIKKILSAKLIRLLPIIKPVSLTDNEQAQNAAEKVMRSL